MISNETIQFEIHFSQPMDCDQITNTIQINSTTAEGDIPQVDGASVQCRNFTAGDADHSQWSGGVDTAFIFAGSLVNVSDGIHQISVRNITNANGTVSTGVSHPFKPFIFLDASADTDARVSIIFCSALVRMIIQWSSLVPQITVRPCSQ